MTDTHDTDAIEPQMLEPVQARVLGCLLEKERTTPAEYPLTLNALTRACNQSTSRWPVVDYQEAEVGAQLDELKRRGLIRFVHSPSNRATKYRHVLGDAWSLDAPQLALLCLLLLRGPQTIAELRSRSERLHGFASTGELESCLASLGERTPPMVLELERSPGQKERRWAQLLTGPVDLAAVESVDRSGGARGALAERVAALEAEVAELRAALETAIGPIPGSADDQR